MNNVESYSLTNVENYYSNLKASLDEIHLKYIDLLSEYFTFILENIRYKNIGFFKFIIQRGIVTITNVFNLVLFYTKNLDMAYYHSQKAFYFYVEYIGQISEERHTFLQLSSRDAIMFVYKKTIFEIPQDFKKSVEKEKEKEIFDNLEIVQRIQMQFIDIIFGNLNIRTKDLDKQIKLYIEKFEIFITQNKFSTTHLENVLLFLEQKIKLLNISIDAAQQLFEKFVKCYYEKYDVASISSIKNNILSLDLNVEGDDLLSINKKILSIFE
jgi:hypothetical protein